MAFRFMLETAFERFLRGLTGFGRQLFSSDGTVMVPVVSCVDSTLHQDGYLEVQTASSWQPYFSRQHPDGSQEAPTCSSRYHNGSRTVNMTKHGIRLRPYYLMNISWRDPHGSYRLQSASKRGLRGWLLRPWPWGIKQLIQNCSNTN